MTFTEKNPEPVAYSRLPLHPPRPSRSRLGQFIHRVATIRDKSGFHKISGLVNLTSAFLLLSYGFITHALTHEWQLPPDTLYTPLLTAWLSSSVLLACSGASLATRYGRVDKPTRDAFVGSSNTVILIAWVTWWASSCFPKILSSQAVSALVLVPLIFFGIYNSFSIARDSDEIITKRRDSVAREAFSTSRNRNLLWWRDYVVYVGPITYGLPFFFISSLVVLYERSTFISRCLLLGDFLPLFAYVNISIIFSVAIANLSVTLRDRGVISRSTEMTVISVQSWLTAAFSTYTVATYGPDMMTALGMSL